MKIYYPVASSLPLLFLSFCANEGPQLNDRQIQHHAARAANSRADNTELKQLCDLRNGAACFYLSISPLISSDSSRSEYLKKSCAADYGDACMVMLRSNGQEEPARRLTEVESDKLCVKAKTQLMNECENGNYESCLALGDYHSKTIQSKRFERTTGIHETGKEYDKRCVPEDLTLAQKYLKIACKHDIAEACGLMANILSESNDPKVGHNNEPARYNLMKRSAQDNNCKGGDSWACKQIANGFSMQWYSDKKMENLNNAIIYFHKSCELGNKLACDSEAEYKKHMHAPPSSK